MMAKLLLSRKIMSYVAHMSEVSSSSRLMSSMSARLSAKVL